MEPALANIDVVGQLAVFLEANDLRRVQATCKLLGRTAAIDAHDANNEDTRTARAEDRQTATPATGRPRPERGGAGADGGGGRRPLLDGPQTVTPPRSRPAHGGLRGTGDGAERTDDALRGALSSALGSGATGAELRRLAEAALSSRRPGPAAEAAPEVPQVILDCDPGGDDVVALLWLLSMQHQGACRIAAVTTAEGNVRAPLTFAAADKVLTFLSAAVGTADVPVCAQTPSGARRGDAAARSAARRAYSDAVRAGGTPGGGVGTAAPPPDGGAAHIHGRDGMGGLSCLLPSRSAYEDAPESHEAIVDLLTAHPGRFTVLATGPLTNLADAERARPGVLRLAKRIIIMGGAVASGGNVTPLAEFNFAFDPASARLVMEESGLTDAVLMPLDVTTELVCTEAFAEQIVGRRLMRDWSGARPRAAPYAPSAGGCRLFFRDLADFMIETNMAFKETKGRRGFLVHDASTVAALFYPETLRFRRAQLCVVAGDGEGGGTLSGHALGGVTFVDDRHEAKTEANCWIGCGIDAGACLSIMVSSPVCF